MDSSCWMSYCLFLSTYLSRNLPHYLQYYFCSLHQVQVMSNTEDFQDQVSREAIPNLFTSLLLYHQWSEILSPSGPRHFGASVSTTCSAGTACLRVLASVLTCTISPANLLNHCVRVLTSKTDFKILTMSCAFGWKETPMWRGCSLQTPDASHIKHANPLPLATPNTLFHPPLRISLLW